MHHVVPNSVSESRRFRHALGSFVTGVAIVTAKPGDAAPVGMTINSFSSVSLDPPLVLWSLRREAWSYDRFRNAGHFVVNVLAAHQDGLAKQFARPVDDRFEGVDFTCNAHGAPCLSSSIACFECVTENTIDAGDHVIFIGRVENFTHSDDIPLVFCRGNLSSFRG